jgi:GT2 family glycosyltransferase
MFTLLNGARENSFAGKVIGPAINLLPEDRDDLPDIVPVEWLNTTCTMYRREALPDPTFPELFVGYSLMEDLALSLNVGKRGWKLANVRTARIFHDSQPSPHKLDVAAVAAMELLNRHYVMTQVLEQRKSTDYLRLLGWEIFSILSTTTTSHGRRNLGSVIQGKWKALRELRNTC